MGRFVSLRKGERRRPSVNGFFTIGSAEKRKRGERRDEKCIYVGVTCWQVYKRRSRDMETETDEDLLQFPAGGSLDASSGSLSSVSLSDKSMSTDNVEEYFGDVPFAGKQQRTLGCTA